MEDLKPCPFCGSEVEMWEAGYGTFHWIECPKCRAEMNAHGRSEKKLAKAWNRRKKCSTKKN